MRTGRLSVVEPLALVSARRFGRHLRCTVCGVDGARYALWFRHPSRAAASFHAVGLAEWAEHRTQLAYVGNRRVGALVDVDELLSRAGCDGAVGSETI